jgi:hypothetical protein
MSTKTKKVFVFRDEALPFLWRVTANAGNGRRVFSKLVLLRRRALNLAIDFREQGFAMFVGERPPKPRAKKLPPLPLFPENPESVVPDLPGGVS